MKSVNRKSSSISMTPHASGMLSRAPASPGSCVKTRLMKIRPAPPRAPWRPMDARSRAPTISAHGLGHRIGYKPRFLSGGERQRVAIGRALVNHPRLILADEPTAALDRDATMNVIRLLKQTTVEDGAAVMMVTHDHRIVNSADRLVHMVDGRIMSDVVLHDALRICEFLRPIELFKALNSAPAHRGRGKDVETSLRRRRDDHPQGRSRK